MSDEHPERPVWMRNREFLGVEEPDFSEEDLICAEQALAEVNRQLREEKLARDKDIHTIGKVLGDRKTERGN